MRETLESQRQPSPRNRIVRDEGKVTEEVSPLHRRSLVPPEARFRNHFKKIKKDQAERLIPLESMRVRITQQDVVYRRYRFPNTARTSPTSASTSKSRERTATLEYRAISRQLVLFCVERRKAWRMLQSKAGIVNKDYAAQRSILADVHANKISKQELFARGSSYLKDRLQSGGVARPTEPRRYSVCPLNRPHCILASQ